MSKPHILIIDDNLNNAKVLSRLLENQNITTTQIIDVLQVVTVLDSLDPLNLVLLDLEMPKLNGYDVKEMIRAHSKHHTVKVVACSVHNSELLNVNEAGFDGFIGKPIDSERFPEQITRLLNGEPVWEAI